MYAVAALALIYVLLVVAVRHSASSTRKSKP